MTPQLMQAIKLLQLSNLDLAAYVDGELERNPLLDRGVENEAASGEPDGTQSPDKPSADGETWNGSEFEPSRDVNEEKLQARVDDTSADDAEPIRPRASDLPAGYSQWAGVGSGGRADGGYNLESFVPAETTLADWLRQ